MPVTEPDHSSADPQPWDLERTSGGSSGGAGAAVAGGAPADRARLGRRGLGAHSRVAVPAVRLQADPRACGQRLRAARPRHPVHVRLAGAHGRGRRGDARRAVAEAATSCGASLGDPPRAACASGVTTHSQLAPTHPEIAEAVRGVAKQLESFGHVLDEARAPEGSVEEFLPGLPAPDARTRPRSCPGRLQPVTALAARGREVVSGRERARDPARHREAHPRRDGRRRPLAHADGADRDAARRRVREPAAGGGVRARGAARCLHRRPRTSAAPPPPRSRWGEWRAAGRWARS